VRQVEIPPSWSEALERIRSQGGFYLVLGATDTGKTTFCRLAVDSLREAGKIPSLVDGDIGQSQYGLPGTIFGLRWDAPPKRERRTLTAFFVGATSPRGASLQCLAGICRVTAAARVGHTDAVLVDTTGYIRGPAAVALKQAKIAALQPDALLLLQRGEEAEPIVSAGHVPQVIRLECPRAVSVRTREQRRERRRARFAAYFANAASHFFLWGEKQIWTGGLPHFEWCLQAETQDPQGTVRVRLLEQVLVRYPGLLVGLRAEGGELRGLGLLTIAEPGAPVEVFSPVAPGDYSAVQLGLITLDRSGEERGRVDDTYE